MKFINLQALKFNVLFPSLLIIIATSLSSCVKSDSASTNLAALTIIHASAGLEPVDFYLNSNRINGDSAFNYTDTISYKFVNSGSLGITVKKYISAITYISKNIELESEKYYSFFIVGKPDSVSYLLVQDNVVGLVAGKAKLRFLNLSANSLPLDFKLTPTSTLFTGQAFKSYTDFTTVDPGTYTVGIYEQGKTTPVAQQTLEIVAGKYYSVWAKGLKFSTDPTTTLSLQSVGVN